MTVVGNHFSSYAVLLAVQSGQLPNLVLHFTSETKYQVKASAAPAAGFAFIELTELGLNELQ
jgi:hypothetical protein